jgi:hypothetical protein
MSMFQRRKRETQKVTRADEGFEISKPDPKYVNLVEESTLSLVWLPTPSGSRSNEEKSKNA